MKPLMQQTRSIRRFTQQKVTSAKLIKLVQCARLAPCGANKQSLRFYLCNQPKHNHGIFATLSWAGYYPNWPGPAANQQPTAYIVVLSNGGGITTQFDAGAACQNMQLAAAELDLGSCILAAVNKPLLAKTLDITQGHEIIVVLALGYPDEQVQIHNMEPGATDIHYWRNQQDTQIVPKRHIDDLIIGKLLDDPNS